VEQSHVYAREETVYLAVGGFVKIAVVPESIIPKKSVNLFFECEEARCEG
jgi:hypothetical protein